MESLLRILYTICVGIFIGWGIESFYRKRYCFGGIYLAFAVVNMMYVAKFIFGKSKGEKL